MALRSSMQRQQVRCAGREQSAIKRYAVGIVRSAKECILGTGRRAYLQYAFGRMHSSLAPGTICGIGVALEGKVLFD